MKTIETILVAVGAACVASPALALNIFACEPEWASLVQELAGDKASVYAATTARQDPHRVEARPSLIARVRSADLVVCTGSELEAGWLPLLLTQSGNNRVQAGSAGYFEASRFVTRIEIPKTVDRSLGDIHPGGNPHIHTDPRNLAQVAGALSERLQQIDRSNAEIYRTRLGSFAERWRSAIARWEREGARLKDVPVVVYHKDFSYLLRWMGMVEAGSLEPRPGIPPSPAHLAGLTEQMKRAPAKAIVYAAYSNPQAAEFLSQRSGIPNVMLPFTVGGSERAKDLFGLFDDTIERLLQVLP